MHNIAYIVHAFDMGGLERCAAHLVNQLPRSRFRPMVISLDHSGGAAQWIQRDDVPIVELHKPPGNDLGVIRRLARTLREHRIDLVHSHNWGTLVETVVACRWLGGIRHVHAEHGLELDEFRVSGLKRQIRRLAMRWSFRRTDAVVACARSVEKWLWEDCGVPPRKMHYIPNGVDGSALAQKSLSRQELRRRLGLGPESFVCGSVGRLVEMKGFATAIEALAHLVSRGPDAHLVIVGEGPARAGLQADAQSAGVAGRVHLVGQQSDVGGWLQSFDLYVNSSHTEAMNMAILEAMAAGLPIVATAVGDTPVLVDGEAPAGVLVPPNDSAALARAIGRLIRSRRALAGFSENARSRYSRHYTAVQMVRRYAELYAELLSTSRRREPALPNPS